MSLSASGRTWEEASSPVAVRVARRYEAAWRESTGKRPEPADFLPKDEQDRAGAQLALLRADLTLRWEAGDKVSVEWYQQRYPELSEEALVALIYEEFCLREDEQETPSPAEYHERFPQLISRLRRVFDIHGLVGSAQTTAAHSLGGVSSSQNEIPFPEVGQTIAGFHLVQELGRGAFARVFLAEERQLADRPVALKVARNGSREPQTLARLQHTHIVPVHSTRTDPATGLHLLCMPYFGRVTLASLLADSEVKNAHAGAELVSALDRLGTDRVPSAGQSTGRGALAKRSFALAIAWWGSRMAEALEHAHERGVLHRDVKPSNVLVTSDGMPMLLDFNLARETVGDDPDSATSTLGGTLDYMAPEHLEALADGSARSVDARSDIYGLGVLLYESLMRKRPFKAPQGARSAGELLLMAAEDRRAGAPSLRATRPDMPAALEAIVRRCLAPDPRDRYRTAGELATDLLAVAEDRPLRFTREPWSSRAGRWVYRNRRALAASVPIMLALGVVFGIFEKSRRDHEKRGADVKKLISEGETSFKNGDFRTAATQFKTARDLATDERRFAEEHRQARVKSRLAEETGRIRENADLLFQRAERLRFRLTRFLGNLENTHNRLEQTLEPFYVLVHHDWTTREDQLMLDPARQSRLHGEVNELLFLWLAAVARDPSKNPRRLEEAIGICNKTIRICERILQSKDVPSKDSWNPGPWHAMRKILLERAGQPVPVEDQDVIPSPDVAPLTCFQWGFVRELEGARVQALEWFRRAVWRESKNYWHHYYLAYLAGESGLSDEALKHYWIAVSLSTKSPWAYLGRGQHFREQGALTSALSDLEQAKSLFEELQREQKQPENSIELRLTRLSLGYVRQLLGDLAGARSEYRELIATNPNDHPGRAARLNQATLDAALGLTHKAQAAYDSLILTDPNDDPARQGRALLALQVGNTRLAESDFDMLVKRSQGRNDQALADRGLARLIQGDLQEAEADAHSAFRLNPTFGHRRLWARTLLALGRVDPWLVRRPEDLARLPLGGSALTADLQVVANRLTHTEADAANPADALDARLNRVLILAALKEKKALEEADQAQALAPLSPRVYLVRGQTRLWLGDPAGAEQDALAGLELDHEDSRLLELRGVARLRLGKIQAGLNDLVRASRLDPAQPSIHGAKAEARLMLDNPRGALADWTQMLSLDPEAPAAYLGRARAYLHLYEGSKAMTDLEQASAWAGDRRDLGLALTWNALRCVAVQPNQFPRAVALIRRTWITQRVGWPLVADDLNPFSSLPPGP